MIYQKHAMHGRHIAVNGLEAEANRKSGWVDVTEADFYNIVEVVNKKLLSKVEIEPVLEDVPVDDDRESAALLYQEKFGKKPHHRMGTETIMKALDDDGE